MPRTYTATFRVHHYDLDAFGELRASAFARLLQQAATEASADAGFDDDWYDRAGAFWLIRRTTIEYHQPVRAWDTLRVRTWVADVRRVRSQREYEVYLGDENEPVASGRTDWVYVERGSFRPRRVPQEIVEGLMPDGLGPPLPRAPWTDDTRPASPFSTTRVVEFRDLDGLAHVNNASYLDYVEETALAASAASGWPLERVLALGGCWRARLHDIEYLAEAVYGDALACASWVSRCAGAELERRTDIHRRGDGVPLARARSRWSWMTRAERRRSDIPVPLAASLLAASPRPGAADGSGGCA
jgi:acyl-CoA thioester hydrolase